MDVERLYDQYWASGLHTWQEWSEAEFQTWLGELASCGSVLDYGCGLGLGYQRRLAKSVGAYTGADVSELALEDLKRKGFNALKIDPQTSSLDCPSNFFDGAVCSEVFEHLFDPLTAAREIHRVMKPGGVLVATVPNFGYHAYRVLAFLRAQVPAEPENPKENRFNGVHIRFFSRLMFYRLFRSAGFENIIIGSYGTSSVWDVFQFGPPFFHLTAFARDNLPRPFHLGFLAKIWPNVFSHRLRAVVYKPKASAMSRSMLFFFVKP
jgi:SAM-dependent methyltransferase